MDFKDRIGRRSILKVGVVSLAGLPALASTASQQKSPGKINPDAGVTAPEDLMKEHGVLNRCLLIYEEAIRRLRNKEEVAHEVFNHTDRGLTTPIHCLFANCAFLRWKIAAPSQ